MYNCIPAICLCIFYVYFVCVFCTHNTHEICIQQLQVVGVQFRSPPSCQATAPARDRSNPSPSELRRCEIQWPQEDLDGGPAKRPGQGPWPAEQGPGGPNLSHLRAQPREDGQQEPTSYLPTAASQALRPAPSVGSGAGPQPHP